MEEGAEVELLPRPLLEQLLLAATAGWLMEAGLANGQVAACEQTLLHS